PRFAAQVELVGRIQAGGLLGMGLDAILDFRENFFGFRHGCLLLVVAGLRSMRRRRGTGWRRPGPAPRRSSVARLGAESAASRRPGPPSPATRRRPGRLLAALSAPRR